MIRAIKAIYNGLKSFFNIIFTVIQFIPRLFSFLFTGVKTLFGLCQTLPSGIIAIAIMLVAVAVLFLIVEIVRG